MIYFQIYNKFVNMEAYKEQQFSQFLSELLETNATLDFFCDFEKIGRNIDDIKISLNTLNYLLGQEDLCKAVQKIWDRDSKAFEALQILIAVRAKEERKVLNSQKEIVPIKKYLNTPEGIVTYLEESGLSKLFRDRTIKNLVDYAFGVEVGLDTHARKNRSGKLMEEYVKNIFKNNAIAFEQQVNSKNYPNIKKVLGGDRKVFDFVVKTLRCTYFIEVNFYHGGGSKPNETARAYTELAPKVNSVEGYEFVWITDGVGWNSAKPMFRTAYNTIENIYNLTHIQDL